MRIVIAAMIEVFERNARPDEANHWRSKLTSLEAATQPAASGPSTAPAASPFGR
jgi:hypothetical protein